MKINETSKTPRKVSSEVLELAGPAKQEQQFYMEMPPAKSNTHVLVNSDPYPGNVSFTANSQGPPTESYVCQFCERHFSYQKDLGKVF